MRVAWSPRRSQSIAGQLCVKCLASRLRRCSNILVTEATLSASDPFKSDISALASPGSRKGIRSSSQAALLAVFKKKGYRNSHGRITSSSSKFFALFLNWSKRGRRDVADYSHGSNSVPNSERPLPSYWFHPLIFRKEIKSLTGDQLSLWDTVAWVDVVIWQITRLSWSTVPTTIRIVCFLAEVR
jgi:hypothetical protein